jgi:hypothetical protein
LDIQISQEAQRVAGKAVDLLTRFVSLVTGCEWLKNSQGCSRPLSPCFPDGCIAALLKKEACGAGKSGRSEPGLASFQRKGAKRASLLWRPMKVLDLSRCVFVDKKAF